MYCMKCGTQLPDTARFCLSCGAPLQGGPAQTNATLENTRTETCEIVYQYTHKGFWGPDMLQFWADAIGTQGAYNAGASEECKCDNLGPQSNNNQHVSALNHLISKLTYDGWQPMTRGQYWYSQRFQRTIKVDTAMQQQKMNYDVLIVSPGPKKIDVIKVIRELTNMGLKEAKDTAETPNGTLLRSVTKETAEDAQRRLQQVGAMVKIV